MYSKFVVRHIQNENGKEQTGISKKAFFVVFFVVLVLLISSIAMEVFHDHEGYDEHCLICHQICELQQLAGLFWVGFRIIFGFSFSKLLLLVWILQTILLTVGKTAVSLKVRMNC